MVKVVRDPVHGDIELSPEELSLVDTPEFQRLRGIKQLGTAYLVYPSAVHTRFEHGLGTLHLVRRLCRRLPEGTLDERQQRVARIAGLLHDVTHIPFGHTFEDERRIFSRHDTPERTRGFLRRGALGDRLRATGLQVEVEQTLTGEAPKPLCTELVCGTVGADLLDYLLRDCYFCGLRGAYDERLFRYFTAAPDAAGAVHLSLSVAKRGRLRADAISEILSLLRLRYTLCERVYFHHAKVAAGAAISRALELAVNEGLVLEDLFTLRDEGLFHYLRERFRGLVPLERLLDRVEARRLYKRAYVLTRAVGDEAQQRLVTRYHADRASREEAERELALAVGIEPEDVILYCPEPRMALKEADIPVLVQPDRPPRPLASLRLPEVDALMARHRDLWRFYVFIAREQAGRAEALGKAAAERFGIPQADPGV